MQGRKRILIVDDDKLVCAALRRMLAKHETEIAADPVEALRWIVEGKRFDVILCDIRMPIPGPQFLRLLRRVRPSLANHVIFITGSAPLEHFKEIGDTRLLRKPFEPSELRKIIEDEPVEPEAA